MTPDSWSSRVLASAFAGVLGADAIGLMDAVATRRAGVREALLKGTPLNAPLPFVAVQALVVATTERARARTGRAAAATLASLGVVSIASGFFDNGYAAVGYSLSPAERGIQAALVAATAITTVAAAVRAAKGAP